MGEVWRARNTQLDRDVAIKALPADLAEDAERHARFEREAKLLASLNHPNVAHVYGFEAATLEDGSRLHFLAMELVEGEDLAERLKRGPIPVDEAIVLAKQIAEALEEAHEKGIVHRDLKPANVKVTADGQVKVLDFGLAKAWDGPGSTSADLSQSPTLAHTGTAAGLILGTAAYMSPEQARGKAVDKRADIWGFGALLYEMLTGRPLFAGDTVSDVLASVLRQEIDWKALPPSVPGELRRLLARCLERNPKNRLHDIGDARIAIDDVVAGKETSADAIAVPARGGRAIQLLVAGALGAGLVLGWLLTRGLASRGGGESFHAEFQIGAPERTSLVSGMALSPDGTKLAFVARGEDGRTALWIRALAEREAKLLPGTSFPSFLPDGKRFLFYASTGTGIEPGTLWLGELGSLDSKLLGPVTSAGIWAAPGYVLYVSGDSLVAHRFDDRRNELVGNPAPLGISLAGTVAVSGLRSLTVASNGLLAYRDDKRGATRLVVTDRSGSELRELAAQGESFHYAPSLSPDGRRVALSQYEPGATSGGLWLRELERKVETRLTFDSGDDMLSAWSPDGREIAYSSVGSKPGTSGI